MAGPNWKLNDDRKTVTVTFPTDPIVIVNYDLSAIEDMLKNLGEFRAAMKPEVSRKAPVAGMIAAVPNPQWYTQPDAMRGDSLLHIRDDRYGWLHYLLPRADALKLGQLLQTQAELPDQTLEPGKAN
jgi:hypothetical protein